jgi:hypothetical protein
MQSKRWELHYLTEGGGVCIGNDLTTGEITALIYLDMTDPVNDKSPAIPTSNDDLILHQTFVALATWAGMGTPIGENEPERYSTFINGSKYFVIPWVGFFDRALVLLIDRLVDARFKNKGRISRRMQLEMAI